MRNDLTIKERAYAIFLQQRGIHYHNSKEWLQVGKPDNNNKWVLHITVSIAQAPALMEQILPAIKEKKIPFQLIKDTNTHYQLNGGMFGMDCIGKMLTLYPTTDEQTKELINVLLPYLEGINGVRLYDAIQLTKALYIAASNGEKTPCPFIPGQYPSPKHKKFFKTFYLLYGNLTFSPKGNVYTAVYWPTLTWYAIKHAPPCIAEDAAGRSIKDRLSWEYTILKKINGIVPAPSPKALINNGDDCYLITTYLEGITLEAKVIEVLNGGTWKTIEPAAKLLLLDYYKQIIGIIYQLHNVGIIHRDLKSKNFLVSSTGKLSVLDFEIAYNVKEQTPIPPFFFGDPFYTAPEQYQRHQPTIHEDIYSLGAILLFLLTGKNPGTIKKTKHQLLQLTNEYVLNELILRCMDISPIKRPTLTEVTTFITSFTESNEYIILKETA